MKEPKPLPLEVPIGCAPEPPEWPTMPEKSEANTETMTKVWEQMVTCIEKEVLGYHDEKWKPEDPRAGRGSETAWVERPVQPLKKITAHISGKEALTWRWLEKALAQILALKGWRNHQPPPEPRPVKKVVRQLDFSLEALQGARSRLKSLPPQAASAWKCLIQRLTSYQVDEQLIEDWRSWAEQEARKLDNMRRNKERADWNEFLDEISTGGAGGLHRMTRPTQQWQPRASAGAGAKQACPLAAAEAAKLDWAKEWRIHEERWQEGDHPWLHHQVNLPPLKEGSLINIGKRFKKQT